MTAVIFWNVVWGIGMYYLYVIFSVATDLIYLLIFNYDPQRERRRRRYSLFFKKKIRPTLTTVQFAFLAVFCYIIISQNVVNASVETIIRWFIITGSAAALVAFGTVWSFLLNVRSSRRRLRPARIHGIDEYLFSRFAMRRNIKGAIDAFITIGFIGSVAIPVLLIVSDTATTLFTTFLLNNLHYAEIWSLTFAANPSEATIQLIADNVPLPKQLRDHLSPGLLSDVDSLSGYHSLLRRELILIVAFAVATSAAIPSLAKIIAWGKDSRERVWRVAKATLFSAALTTGIGLYAAGAYDYQVSELDAVGVLAFLFSLMVNLEASALRFPVANLETETVGGQT